MSVAVIELNDLALKGVSGDVLISEPGFAYLGSSELVLGEAALAYARLHPRQTLHNFWQRLDTSAIADHGLRLRHHADIAYQQLLLMHKSLGMPDDIIFVLPGSFSEEHMAMLLGLAQQCPFNAVAIVDYAVASLAGLPAISAQNTLLELQLHQSVVYQLSVDNGQATLTNTRVHEKGYMELLEQCAAMVSREFIAQCRFDPLHNADTEQQLFARVHAALSQDDTQYVFEISSAGRIVTSRVERQQFDQLFAAFAADFHQGDVDFVGANLGHIPGLRAQFPRARVGAADAAASYCLSLADSLRSYANSLAFITQLPCAQEPVRAPLEASPTAASASHYLIDSCAYPLQETTYLTSMGKAILHSAHQAGSADVVLTRQGTAVIAEAGIGPGFIYQGERVTHAELQRGDSISLQEDGSVFHLIELVTGDAQ